MKKNKKLVIISGLIVLTFIGFWNLKLKNTKTNITNERVRQEFKATLVLEDGSANPSFDITQYIGRTALETTQSVLKDKVKTSGTGKNAFVTGLNGRDIDSKKHEFWEFLVNGKQAEVGAGTYIIQNSDNIVWRVSTY